MSYQSFASLISLFTEGSLTNGFSEMYMKFVVRPRTDEQRIEHECQATRRFRSSVLGKTCLDLKVVLVCYLTTAFSLQHT